LENYKLAKAFEIRNNNNTCCGIYKTSSDLGTFFFQGLTRQYADVSEYTR